MRTITRTVELDATPAQVWEVLTDARAHADWNPFITTMYGALEVGRRIEVRIAPPGGKTMTNKLGSSTGRLEPLEMV